MRIGDLKHRIILQYKTRVSDGMGSFTETWNDGDTIYAAIWPTSAKELVAADSVSMVVSHRIRIRYRKDIRASWRIKYKNAFYNIVSIVNPNMENKILDIMAKEAA